jgi:hypothetical protein
VGARAVLKVLEVAFNFLWDIFSLIIGMIVLLYYSRL